MAGYIFEGAAVDEIWDLHFEGAIRIAAMNLNVMGAAVRWSRSPQTISCMLSTSNPLPARCGEMGSITAAVESPSQKRC